MPELVHIHTDGSCLKNPNGPGGWAAILVLPGSDPLYEKEFVGSDPSTTNNRMEMQAVISGLQMLTRPCDVLVHSDSEYVVKGATQWIDGWIRRRWRNSQGDPVANQDLWLLMLDVLAAQAKVDFTWVRGHSGDAYNERCDKLAGIAARSIAQGVLK